SKCCELRDGNRFAGRKPAVFGQRIHEYTVLSQPVIEMRPGRCPGRANASNEFPLIDMRARANAFCKSGEVQVIALETAGVADPHHVSATPTPSGRHNGPGRNGDDGRTHRSPVVDTEMCAVGAIDGMQAAP